MCPKCILLDTDSRSYRNVVIPIALQSSLVFNPLLALAASQMPDRVQDASHMYKETALKYQGYSLRVLARRITMLDGLADRSEILGAILMLCLFEVMNNTFRPDPLMGMEWNIHSAGAKHVLESPVLDLRFQTNIEMSSFLGQMLSAHHVLQYTTLSSTSDDGQALHTAQYWLSKTTRSCREINCFAGCSNELLAIISNIVNLVRQKRYVAGKGVGVSKAMLENKIEAISQELPDFGGSRSTANKATTVGPRGPVLTREERFLHVAESYRLATMILAQYLDAKDLPGENKMIRRSVEMILSEASMKSALSLPPPGKACRSGPMWPVFIASCHATTDNSRVDVVRHFEDTMRRDGSTSDVLGPMMEVIQSVWRQQDLKHVVLAPSGETDTNTWRFPWEEALCKKGWELSW